ncbi:hypothetical protein CBM2587_B90680 [Cupriavidus taiwanensis]|uniref:Uncharacterized protein n=1 Tax=Cupriavidus taiwanensis TaxID=164546 RepID=A0A375CEC0_9BURK|nr:hypothetical protein CBM2587_B90680 [Cupriavidus taiwanensis]
MAVARVSAAARRRKRRSENMGRSWWVDRQRCRHGAKIRPFHSCQVAGKMAYCSFQSGMMTNKERHGHHPGNAGLRARGGAGQPVGGGARAAVDAADCQQDRRRIGARPGRAPAGAQHHQPGADRGRTALLRARAARAGRIRRGRRRGARHQRPARGPRARQRARQLRRAAAQCAGAGVPAALSGGRGGTAVRRPLRRPGRGRCRRGGAPRRHAAAACGGAPYRGVAAPAGGSAGLPGAASENPAAGRPGAPPDPALQLARRGRRHRAGRPRRAGAGERAVPLSRQQLAGDARELCCRCRLWHDAGVAGAGPARQRRAAAGAAALERPGAGGLPGQSDAALPAGAGAGADGLPGGRHRGAARLRCALTERRRQLSRTCRR